MCGFLALLHQASKQPLGRKNTSGSLCITFRLRNVASGPEIVDLWGLNGPLPTAKLIGKSGGRSPLPFPVSFAFWVREWLGVELA